MTVSSTDGNGEYLCECLYAELTNNYVQSRYTYITTVDPDVASRITSVGTQVTSVGNSVDSVWYFDQFCWYSSNKY